MGDRDDHLLVGDQVLDVDLALGVRDLGAPLVAVGLDDLGELVLDDAVDLLLVAEDLAELLDPLDEVGMLLLDLVRLERRQSAQGQLEDGLRLDQCQLEPLDEPVAGRLRVPRAADHRDHLVEVGERDEQTLQHVRALLGPAQLVLRAADDDVALVIDVVADHLTQGQRPRDVVDERDHVDAERRLHRRVLVKLVEHDLGDRVALELDHDPHAVAVGLVLGDRRSR